MKPRTRALAARPLLVIGLVVLVSLAAVAAADAQRSTSTASSTLVVDKSFDLKTSDPQRQFEPTGGIVDRALYDTLLQFKGADVAHPAPDVARRWTVSKDAKKYTFFLRKDVRFSDGTKLTSKDVVFSYKRLINLKGNPSFLLSGITVSAKGLYTVVLKSKTPNPAIPGSSPTRRSAIVNSKVVQAHGGTDAANADKTDKAEAYLNTTSAGSGPYVLKSFSTTSQVVLTANPKYWGKTKPHFTTVVLRNVNAAAQLLDVQRGTNEISLDLSPDQSKGLSGVQVHQVPSANVWFLFANSNPKVSPVSSNPHIQAAIRYALDYKGYVRLAGSGAVQAAGVVPSMFLGALPQSDALKQNVAKAKSELAASGIKSPTLSLEFPSDITLERPLVRGHGAEGEVRPRGGRVQGEPRRQPGRDLAEHVPRGHRAARPLVLGPRLPGPERLPRVPAGPDGRPPRRLGGRLRPGGRGARQEGRRRRRRRPPAASSSSRSRRI